MCVCDMSCVVEIRSRIFLPTLPSVASRGVALAVSEGGEARPALRVTGEAKPTLYTAAGAPAVAVFRMRFKRS